MVSISASDFAALAHSSPWRWSTVRFTARLPNDPWRPQDLRAWLRRPDRLRVETVDGTLVQVVHESPEQVGVVTSDGDRYTTTLPWPSAPEAPRPSLRADGLVAARPERFPSEVSSDGPMYQNYFWVAMLDPVELADGYSPDADASVPGTDIDAVAEVAHAGRLAWEALVTPMPGYEPRCTCCSLLRSREVDMAEAESGAGYQVKRACVCSPSPSAAPPGLDTSWRSRRLTNRWPTTSSRTNRRQNQCQDGHPILGRHRIICRVTHDSDYGSPCYGWW